MENGKRFYSFYESGKDIVLSTETVPFANEGAMSIEFRDVFFRYPYQESYYDDGYPCSSEEDIVEQDLSDFYDNDGREDELNKDRHERNIEDSMLEKNKDSIGDSGKRSDYVLDNINFSVSPGEKIAIVGANGSGKTTLIKLLCQFYEFNQGEIKVNGIDIRDLDLDELWQCDRFKTCTLFFMILLESLLGPLLIWLSAEIIDEITRTPFKLFSWNMLVWMALIYITFTLIVDALQPLVEMQKRLLTVKLQAHIDGLLINKAISIPDIAPFEQASYHTRTQIICFRCFY
ncbi:ATP-binding cassette domain-containing protein [Viridibacillus sp. YIM B01967]|uniref:ATP-binding cassette domain-containing protein n=1 Tax=Viridibacillus soli TaxID=2798301 RepID=A0ABS1H4S7_9BACL|nr:ATP-binding cassette domain-containing protein [Viridibacillus soli]MBK3494058.1 ATP-binding cassette domain-containing protein [Viridibacillus soli]